MIYKPNRDVYINFRCFYKALKIKNECPAVKLTLALKNGFHTFNSVNIFNT